MWKIPLKLEEMKKIAKARTSGAWHASGASVYNKFDGNDERLVTCDGGYLSSDGNNQESFGERMTFYLTFGQQHPSRDGWVEVEADSESDARKKVFDVYGNKWSGLYLSERFGEDVKQCFPSGKLGELK